MQRRFQGQSHNPKGFIRAPAQFIALLETTTGKLVSGGWGGASIWELTPMMEGKLVHQFNQDCVVALANKANDIISVGLKGSIKFLDMESFSTKTIFSDISKVSAAFYIQPSCLILGGTTNDKWKISAYDTRSGKQRDQFGAVRQCYCFAYLSENLLCCGDELSISLWRSSDLKPCGTLSVKESSPEIITLLPLSYHPSLISSSRGSLRHWNLVSSMCMRVLQVYEHPRNKVVLATCGEWSVAAAGNEHKLVIWDVRVKVAGQRMSVGASEVCQLGFLSVHQTLVSSHKDDIIRIWI